METRVCKKCNRELPIEDFYLKCKGSKYRRRTCRYCVIEEKGIEWRTMSEEKHDKIRARKRELFKKDIENNREKRRVWVNNNFEKVKKTRDKFREKSKGDGRKSIWESCMSLIRKNNLRPSLCSMCGGGGHIHAHHPDYNKPMEVIFVCSLCHGAIHSGQLEVDKTKIVDLNKYRKNKSSKIFAYSPIED